MKPTDYPVERYTRREALKKAFMDSFIMVVSPCVVLSVALLFRLDEKFLLSTDYPADKIPLMHWAAWVTVATVFGWFLLGGTLTNYLQLRGMPTRAEKAEEYRQRLAAFEEDA